MPGWKTIAGGQTKVQEKARYESRKAYFEIKNAQFLARQAQDYAARLAHSHMREEYNKRIDMLEDTVSRLSSTVDYLVSMHYPQQ